MSESGGHSETATGRVWSWTGPPTLAAVREASRGIRHFLTESGLPEDEVAAWELLIAEAGNNCVLHPDGPTEEERLDLIVSVTPGKVTARLRDQTPGFDWPENPELPPDDAESGRGLFLIHQLTDSRLYARSSKGNLLELERACPGAGPPREDLEGTLFAMTEELSSCYESLASIFRFIAESRDASSMEDFASQVLDHLAMTTTTQLGILRLSDSGGTLTTLARYGTAEIPPLAIETEAARDRLDRWFEGPLAGLGDESPICGMVHPFGEGEQLMGTVLLARNENAGPFNAGEISMIRTFSEFLTQHILNRRHEEEAIRSSVARHEFELAASIQRSLLPPDPPALCGVSATGHCESALTIGGDFYDIIPLEGRGFFFVMADVMGKGVAASMIAAVTRSVVRSFPEDYLEPAKLLGKVGARMWTDLDRLEMFVTIAVGVVDAPAGMVRVANAGHCPVVVAGGDEATADPSNPPLGLEQCPVFREHHLPMPPGSHLLAYTDGFVDPRNESPAFAEEAEVARWFWDEAQKTPSQDHLRERLLNRLGHGKLADDQTFLLLSRKEIP